MSSAAESKDRAASPVTPTTPSPTTLEAVSNFSDDGATSFIWRRHTLLVLVVVMCYLIYTSVFEDDSFTSEESAKRGVGAIILMFLILGVTQFNDGPFTRPHPAIWRFFYTCSVIYWLFLVFLLFQSPKDGRSFMKHLDPTLGVHVSQVTYKDECELYLPNDPQPYKNIVAKMDRFVIAHVLGWFIKAVVLRNAVMCHIASIIFEFLEYTLEFQLPNFGECWWDHWILDVLMCNALGIYLGSKFCRMLEMKQYHWQGFFRIKTTGGKFRRVVQQFTPYYWTHFNWQAFSDLKHFLGSILVVFLLQAGELTAFYMKEVLWVPASNNLNIYRLILMTFSAAVSTRECYEFVHDTTGTKRFGQQTWVVVFIIFTEFLITYKYGGHLSKDADLFWVYFWLVSLALLALWILVYFVALPILRKRRGRGTSESDYGRTTSESSETVKKTN